MCHPRQVTALAMLIYASAAVCIGPSNRCGGQHHSAAGTSASVPILRTDRSRHFLLHSDLSRQDAAAQLQRLENTLQRVADYWGRPSSGLIECFVARDVSSWPDSALPHPLGRISIARIGGMTVPFTEKKRGKIRRRAIVFSIARPGIPEHEIVHAYCLQTFGESGPTWYKEGMGEMGYHGIDLMPGVRCPKEFVEFFRTTEPQSVDRVISSGAFTRSIANALIDIADSGRRTNAKVQQYPIDAWTEEDTKLVTKARESYRWSWSLCHMLCKNPNYSERFRALGQSYLTGRSDTFEQAFAAVRPQVEFEYDFFMRRFDIGYRVDLCRWDWSTPFESLSTRESVTTHIAASRGFQATRLRVTAGDSYHYQCRGSWKTNPISSPTGAEGRQDGKGRLIGVVMKDFSLSNPFELGKRGTFQAPCDGKLYVRCQDDWNQLFDNQGSLTLQLRLARN